MQIAYIEPFRRAWDRMKVALFNPFSVNKWFVIGFNAFLAGLLSGHNGGAGSSDSYRHRIDNFGEVLDLPERAWDWLMHHPGWSITILSGVIVLIALLIILTWLSSRGTFMFLDNVIQNKAEIANPWKQYKTEGNSLFLWRLGFGILCLMMFVVVAVVFFTIAPQLYTDSYDLQIPIPLIAGLGLLFLLLIIILAYISLFLKDFVAPIMYKHRIAATQAWGRFLPILKEHTFHFIVYGIFILFISILAVIGIVLAAVMTCCVGFLIVVIPYIGTVVTLPAWYTLRAFSLEFLAQFGDEFNVFPPPPEPSPQNVPAQ